MTSQRQRNLSRTSAVVGLLIGTLPMLLGQTLPAPEQPALDLIVLHIARNKMEITGGNFGSAAPVVSLNGSPSKIVNHTPTKIVAEMPTLKDGSYTLAVRNVESSAENRSDFRFNLKAQQAEPVRNAGND